MDERKNVKVIDGNGVERDASVMCGIDLVGSDYVVYSIKRDNTGESDNIFVSKLIRNNDGTSNMVNIDDSMEKSQLSSVVKELITYAINSDADKSTGVVKLNDGREVKIIDVLFNKVQNINVDKTYITTVKRAVTKVGSNFYNIPFTKPEPVVESVFDVPTDANSVFPEVNNETPSVVNSVPETAPVVEPILPEVPVNDVVSVPPVLPDVSNVVSTPSTPVVEAAPLTSAPVEPILPETNQVTSPVVEAPAQVEQTPLPNAAAQIMNPKQEEVVVPPISVVEPTPTPVVAEETNNLNFAPAVAPSTQLVFDGTKETNLNSALGEVSKDNILPVQDVTSIREFGQDEPVVNTTDNVVPVVPKSEGPVLTRKAGFANNKFFMVIAIAFFLAACVFLGYEVFQYFKIVG